MALPHILVVDDSPSLRRMIGACLRTGGYEVTEAPDGEAARTLALDAAPDAAFGMLITDQVMPGIDGLTLIRSLREAARYADIPILMLTTEGDPDLPAKAREAGASGFLAKPFEPDQLVDAVAALLAPA